MPEVFALNHTRMFRPLLGGICIQNEITRDLGTLGCVVDDGIDRWIVSAYHVLVRADSSSFAPGEKVFQPTRAESVEPVAELVTGRADRALDVAAARLFPNIVVSNEILGIGPVQAVAAPIRGQRVIKAGIATGVTEGIVDVVTEDRIEITTPSGYPSKYELTTISDSGALWLTRDTHQAIAIHIIGEDRGAERAFAVPFAAALAALHINPV